MLYERSRYICVRLYAIAIHVESDLLVDDLLEQGHL